MPRRRTVLALLATGLAGCAGGDGEGSTPTATDAATTTPTRTPTPASTPTPEPTVSTPGADYETATVEIVDEDGTLLATVDVWVADTFAKRYTGLSDTTALEPGQGMLFVHKEEERHAYVMRDMDFPLDMVFIAADGTITTIHRAPLPPEGTGGSDLKQYSGVAKYVLEVPMGYTEAEGIEEGDVVRVGDV